MNLKHYAPSDPCRRGHRSPRFVSNGVCVACHRWREARERARSQAQRSPLHAEKARFFDEVVPVRCHLSVDCSPTQAQEIADEALRARFPLLMASGFTYGEATPVHWGGPLYTVWAAKDDADLLRVLTAPSTSRDTV